MAGRNGNKKHSRNKIACARYRDEARAEKSKGRKLLAHVRRCPWDDVARAAYERLPVVARKVALPPKAKSPAAIRREKGITLTGQVRQLAA